LFLFERLFGIGVYCFALLAVCMLISYSTISYKALLNFYIVILAVMAYFYEPYITADLYRIIQTMKIYASLDFSSFVHEFVVSSSSPVPRFLYWVVGRIGAYHLISVISTVISYYLIFYIIRKTAEKYSISRQNISVALLFLMSTSIYMSVIGGVRMMIAMSMISFCFFRESVEKKFNVFHVLLYILALFTHNMAIVIVGIRLAVLVFAPGKKLVTRFLICLTIAVGAVVAVLGFDSLLADIWDKASEFLFEESYSYFWEYVMGVIILIGFLGVCVKFQRLRGREHTELVTYNMGAMFSAGISVVFFFVFSIFYRFIGHVTPILGLPMLMVTLEESEKNVSGRFKQMSFQSITVMFSLVILALSISRGSLSSLKFFALG